jgi:hypothetical protein
VPTKVTRITTVRKRWTVRTRQQVLASTLVAAASALALLVGGRERGGERGRRGGPADGVHALSCTVISG